MAAPTRELQVILLGSFVRREWLEPERYRVLNSVWSVMLAVEAERPVAFQWGNISDGNGIPIAITGMLIVFVALTLISFAIAALPRILTAIDPYLPAVDHRHQPLPPAESLPADEERVVAAIGMVLYAEMRKANKQVSN